MAEPLNVWEYEQLAEGRLDEDAFGYFAGGAGDEWTLRENLAAFRRWVLRPRMLVDVGTVSTEATVLGRSVEMPVLVAPTALHRALHPDGEIATARGAAAAGTVMCVSNISSYSPAELADAAPTGRRWFQLYWGRDRGFTRDLLAAVTEAGFEALVLTVDLPGLGRRERDVRSGFELTENCPFPNVPGEVGSGQFHVNLDDVVDPTLTWADLEWLHTNCPLPLIVKGILTAEDADIACEHGAAGIVVSNHGGRQLDGVAATLDALPEAVEAVAGRAEVLMDGGVRRGTDVIKALAHGAKAVMVGRPVIWGLAVDGEAGVLRVLELLREEVLLALVLLGCHAPDEVTREHVARAAQ